MTSNLRGDVDGARAARLSPVKQALLELRLADPQAARPAGAATPALDRARQTPLGTASRRIWLLEQLQPGTTAHVVQEALRISGALDVAELEHAAQGLLQAHELLRSTVAVTDGSPGHVVHERVESPLTQLDLGALAEPDRSEALVAALAEEANRPFDLVAEVPLRLLLIRLGDAEHVLVVSLHRIAATAISVAGVVRAVLAPSVEPPATDVAPADGGRTRAEWRSALAGVPVESTFPADRRRPAVQSYRGGGAATTIDEAVANDLARIAGTLEAGLLAGVVALLSRYTQGTDFVVGYREAAAEEAPVRVNVDESTTFLDLCASVSREIDATRGPSVPLEELLEEARIERDLSRPPLFQVVLDRAGAEASAVNVPGLELQRIEIHPTGSPFDLVLSAAPFSDGSVRLQARYSRDIYDRATVERVLGHLEGLLAAATTESAAPVATLPVLRDEERSEMLSHWNDTERPFPADTCIHHMFERWVDLTPDARAVSFEDEHLSYAELDARANTLAAALSRAGVGPDTTVGICLERSLELFVAVLGVLKAGGAYVPLDPAYPDDRIAFMLRDSGAPVLITHTGLRDGLPAHEASVLCVDDLIDDASAVRPSSGAGPDNLAYVIYTSGSTGLPKGVMIEHRGACNLAVAHVDEFELGPGARVLQFSSLSFDACVWEMLMSLTTGAELVLARRESLLPGPDLVELLRERRITLVLFPPSTLALLPHADLPDLRTLLVGGEACQPELATRWAQGRRFVNCYGPTEATVLATTSTCVDGRRTPPIGRPIANVSTYVLDPRGEPVPVGVAGELHVGGAGVGRGYLDRPELTAERFVPDPFAEVQGARMYRTGDLVRYLATGELEYLGRLDHQVKIRGFRIEIGEIEATLSRHPQVRDCAVLAREDVPGDKRLVAYVVLGEEATSTGELRDFLRQMLPEHFVPAAFVTLEALPITPAKKVDRAALPRPDGNRPDVERPYVAPRTPFEELAARYYADVLGLDRVGALDGFFELGGDSLRATQVASRLSSAIGVAIPLRALFEHPAAADLARVALQHALARSGGDPGSFAERVGRLSLEKRAILEQQLLRPTAESRSVIQQRSPDDPLVLSFAQQRLWFLDQWAPGSPLYNAAVAVRLSGELDRDALRTALDRMVERHEALRTVFRAEGGVPKQVVLDHAPLELVEVDLAELPPGQREPMLQQVLREQARRSFDLAADVLIRPVLVRLAPATHVLQLVVHHIASDGWSKGILFRELAAHYAAARLAEPTPLPPLPIQYADFALWQRRTFSGDEFEQQISYWRTQLEGSPPYIDLPVDRPRPVAQSFEGVHQHLSLSAELAAGVRAAAREEGVTPFMFLLATFAVLLGAYAGQDDVLVGSPIANRHRIETEDLIGFFVNTLVLRTDLSGDPTFHELAQRVRESSLGAYAHQDMPFEQIVEVLKPRRHAGRNPLFQVNFRVQGDEGPQLELADLDVTPVEVDIGTSRFDLALELQLGDEGIGGYFEYSVDLFDATTIKRMAGNFVQLLNEVVAAPGNRISELTAVADIVAHREAILSRSALAAGGGELRV